MFSECSFNLLMIQVTFFDAGDTSTSDEWAVC